MNLVTGATGHIGNTLVRELLSRGERIRALILPGEDAGVLDGLDIERIQGNVLDPISLSYAMRGVDMVYHLAGIISILPGKNELMRAVNVSGTANVARAAREAGVRRMVYTSSIHALCRPPFGTCIEEGVGFDPENPAGEYDRTKAQGSLALLAEVEKGLDAVLVCPTGVIGPYDYRRSEMGHLVRSWMKKRLHVFVDGWFDWVDCRDIAGGIILAGQKGRKGETYILAGERVHLAELLRLIQESSGVRTPAVCVPTKLAIYTAPLAKLFSKITGAKQLFTKYSLETIVSNSVISHEKAHRELGYTPRPLAETVYDTVAWWREYELTLEKAKNARRPARARRPVQTVMPRRERVAVVTGASSGIGAATAQLLAGRGYRVVLAARRMDRLEALAERIRGAGGKADAVQADFSRPDGPQELYRAVAGLGIGADVLINNAGFGWYGYYEQMPHSMARDMIQVNASAMAQLILLFLPEMKKRGSGHIVNVSSVAGSIPSQGTVIYSATKSFVNSLSKALARELRGSGVHVSDIRPGPVVTEFFRTAAARESGRPVPAERFAVPVEHVARAIFDVIRRPRRVAYVPWGLRVTPWIEAGFGWLMNLLGPLLLRRGMAGARAQR
jgi:dihydroflavonol-4-reductase